MVYSCVQNSIERLFWAGNQSNHQNFEKNDTSYETQGCFHWKKPSWATPMPFAEINSTNQRTNPWNVWKKYWELEELENELFWLAILKYFLNFFSNENNLGFHMRYHFFRNFDDYPGFQPKTTFLYYFAHDCITNWQWNKNTNFTYLPFTSLDWYNWYWE